MSVLPGCKCLVGAVMHSAALWGALLRCYLHLQDPSFAHQHCLCWGLGGGIRKNLWRDNMLHLRSDTKTHLQQDFGEILLIEPDVRVLVFFNQGGHNPCSSTVMTCFEAFCSKLVDTCGNTDLYIYFSILAFFLNSVIR